MYQTAMVKTVHPK
jgi:hypothetical protein